jgi:hypothetical protein
MPAPRRSITASSGRAHGFEGIFATAGNLLLQPIEPAHPSLTRLSVHVVPRSMFVVKSPKRAPGNGLSPTEFYPAAAITLGMLSEPLPPRRRRKNALRLLGLKLG